MQFSRFLQLTKLSIVKAPIPIRQFSNLHIQKSSNFSLTLPLLEKASVVYNPWIYQQNENLNISKISNLKIDIPKNIILPKIEPITSECVIEDPALDGSVKKEAVNMLIIRRKKMKKHKLKKLRKKMKYEYAKKRQRRELKKEKEFQAVLIKQCKDAEVFSAEKYVEDKIKKLADATEVLTQSQILESNSFTNKF